MKRLGGARGFRGKGFLRSASSFKRRWGLFLGRSCGGSMATEEMRRVWSVGFGGLGFRVWIGLGEREAEKEKV